MRSYGLIFDKDLNIECSLFQFGMKVITIIHK